MSIVLILSYFFFFGDFFFLAFPLKLKILLWDFSDGLWSILTGLNDAELGDSVVFVLELLIVNEVFELGVCGIDTFKFAELFDCDRCCLIKLSHTERFCIVSCLLPWDPSCTMELTEEVMVISGGFFEAIVSIVCDCFRFCELNRLCFELKILLRKLLRVRENDFECSRDLRDSAISFLSNKNILKELKSFRYV